MNSKEEFNKEIENLYASWQDCDISLEDLSFSDYCKIYYLKIQSENILRIDGK